MPKRSFSLDSGLCVSAELIANSSVHTGGVQECFLAVLGTCCSMLDHGESGVGKSSLCSRFIHPGVDTWQELGHDHSHWLSQIDFSEAEINGDHFVYFGAAKRQCRHVEKGSRSERAAAAVQLKVHVTEHTVFVDDSRGRPFPGAGDYTSRSTSSVVQSQTSGKASYSCRSRLGISAGQGCERVMCEHPKFPDKYSKRAAGVDGYLFVLDPSKSAGLRQKQWQVFAECWENLPARKRDKCAIALSKCDAVVQKLALYKAFNIVSFFQQEKPTPRKGKKIVKFHDCPGKLAIRCGKCIVPVFLTSATQNCGVDVPFLYLAKACLQLPGLRLSPVTWPDLIRDKQQLDQNSLLSANSYLKKSVTTHTAQWDQLKLEVFDDPRMASCRRRHGLDVCRSLFRSHLVHLTIPAAERRLKQDIANKVVHGIVQFDPTRKSKQMRSYLTELAQSHPDLRLSTVEKKRHDICAPCRTAVNEHTPTSTPVMDSTVHSDTPSPNIDLAQSSNVLSTERDSDWSSTWPATAPTPSNEQAADMHHNSGSLMNSKAVSEGCPESTDAVESRAPVAMAPAVATHVHHPPGYEHISAAGQCKYGQSRDSENDGEDEYGYLSDELLEQICIPLSAAYPATFQHMSDLTTCSKDRCQAWEHQHKAVVSSESSGESSSGGSISSDDGSTTSEADKSSGESNHTTSVGPTKVNALSGQWKTKSDTSLQPARVAQYAKSKPKLYQRLRIFSKSKQYIQLDPLPENHELPPAMHI
ncbi:uncharacterized protein LOC135830387 [Sycon ciliatum]|uniref:uncharacterized protein LOC135830387 n=1 Tax=Sycon ciliatum TaxID=27933 RepID=UPI0031F6E833